MEVGSVFTDQRGCDPTGTVRNGGGVSIVAAPNERHDTLDRKREKELI